MRRTDGPPRGMSLLGTRVILGGGRRCALTWGGAWRGRRRVVVDHAIGVVVVGLSASDVAPAGLRLARLL
eukprot:588217-Pyramimonas_sp.AAC.1